MLLPNNRYSQLLPKLYNYLLLSTSFLSVVASDVYSGIAGASYIPTVEAALPRLLGAAAPPGTGAHENRRQCRKVIFQHYP